jgi:hypothetical protein
MKINEIFDYSHEAININLSDAEYVPDATKLEYDIKDLTIETDEGTVTISDAGVIKLNFDHEEFLEQVEPKIEQKPKSFSGLYLINPLSDFSCESCSGPTNLNVPYSIGVDYISADGTEANTVVTFNNSTFIPSNEFVKKTSK